MLLKKCVCGNQVDETFSHFEKNGLKCATCLKCNISHQLVDLTEKEYLDFYDNYHIEYQNKLNQPSYDRRYHHDCEVAKSRLKKYKLYIKGKRLLDVGSSNGAFVCEARNMGLDAWGVEPNKDIGPTEITYHGTLLEQDYLDGEFDTITMHDVLEHVIDPVKDLDECKRILSKGGLLILDMPNFWVAEGKHHWRPIEHLWLFSKENLSNLLENLGWEIAGIDIPIPGKYVIYANNK